SSMFAYAQSSTTDGGPYNIEHLNHKVYFDLHIRSSGVFKTQPKKTIDVNASYRMVGGHLLIAPSSETPNEIIYRVELFPPQQSLLKPSDKGSFAIDINVADGVGHTAKHSIKIAIIDNPHPDMHFSVTPNQLIVGSSAPTSQLIF